MSYNPTRVKNRPRRSRSKYSGLKKHGVKHSEIVARQGVGSFSPNINNREDTHTGFVTPLHKCNKFTQYYECMFPGNKTKTVVNKKGDRTIYVLKGSLWATIGEVSADGKLFDAKRTEVKAGNSLVLSKRVGYNLSTGTIQAEFLSTDSPKYFQNIEEVEYEEPVFNVSEEVYLASNNEDVDKPKRRPRSESKAKLQAQKLARRKQGKQEHQIPRNRPVQADGSVAPARSKDKYNNPNSASAGINPMPSGPPAED